MKLSDLTPEQWYGRLGTKIFRQAEDQKCWEQYMDLKQPLIYVARILAEQEDRFPALLLPWSDVVVGSVDERLKWESFLLENEDPADDLNKLWQASDFDEQASETHTAAMVSGKHFLMIGPGDGEFPLITGEYGSQVAVEIDPRTRQPIAGLKVWCEDLELGGDVLGALYLPGGICYEFRNTKIERRSYVGDWSKKLEADPRLPSVPFVPMLNKPRRGEGRSDLVQLKPTLDAANQFATNLMAAGESHAVARKWAVGVSEKDFVDKDGKPVDAWVAAMRAVWAVPHADPEAYRGGDPPEVKLGQFTASDLSNFHNSVKMMAQIASSAYGLPPNYMGYSSENPPSAESILFSLERLVLRTEAHQGWYGSSYKKANAVAWTVMGRNPEDIRGHEVKWRNAATPTFASRMDAASKALGAGAIDAEQLWIDVGYSEQTKKGLRERMGRAGKQAAQSLRELDRVPVQPEVPNAPVLRS